MKTLINAIKTWCENTFAKASSIKKADWENYDSSDNAFIKNKPFYDSRKYETVTKEYPIRLEDAVNNCVANEDLYNQLLSILDNGKKITYTQNGIKTDIDGHYFFRVDVSHSMEQFTNNGTYVFHYWFQSMSGNTGFFVDESDYTLSYSETKFVSGELKKIDDKFIDFSTVDSSKMDKENPTGSGSFSLNRKSGTAIIVGDYSFAEGSNCDASGYASHAEGQETIASGSRAHAEGERATASGYDSHAEGVNSLASNYYSHAECQSTTASGHGSHAEGYKTTASGSYSHAEGNTTTASGSCSHAEGYNTKAFNSASHAEGQNTTAYGFGTHSEGYYTTANGNYSHAEGYYTTSGSKSQHVQGKYNINDTASTYAHIVGNGTDDSTRSNAHTLDWSGNAWFAGDVYTGSTSGTNKDNGSKKLATEDYAYSKTEQDNLFDNKANKPFVINATIDYDAMTCTVDKTFAEITEAYNNGYTLQVLASGALFILTYVYEEQALAFSSEWLGNAYEIYLYNDDSTTINIVPAIPSTSEIGEDEEYILSCLGGNVQWSDRNNYVPSPGEASAGQVLKLDNNLNPVWEDESGGSAVSPSLIFSDAVDSDDGITAYEQTIDFKSYKNFYIIYRGLKNDTATNAQYTYFYLGGKRWVFDYYSTFLDATNTSYPYGSVDKILVRFDDDYFYCMSDKDSTGKQGTNQYRQCGFSTLGGSRGVVKVLDSQSHADGIRIGFSQAVKEFSIKIFGW